MGHGKAGKLWNLIIQDNTPGKCRNLLRSLQMENHDPCFVFLSLYLLTWPEFNQWCFIFKVIFVGLFSWLLIFILKLYMFIFVCLFMLPILRCESTMDTAMFQRYFHLINVLEMPRDFALQGAGILFKKWIWIL